MNPATRNTLGIIALLFGLVLVLYWYAYTHISELGTTLRDQLARVETSVARDAARIQLREVSEETKTDRDRLKDFFLGAEGESVSFLNFMEGELAPQYGVVLETNNLRQVEAGTAIEGLKWIEFTFKFSGSEAAVRTFIAALEVLPYHARVISLTLANEGDESTGTVALQVAVISYENS
jgi:hypothetical protein